MGHAGCARLAVGNHAAAPPLVALGIEEIQETRAGDHAQRGAAARSGLRVIRRRAARRRQSRSGGVGGRTPPRGGPRHDGPGRRITGSPRETGRRWSIRCRPCTVRHRGSAKSRSPNSSWRTWAAVVGLIRPKRFAEGAAIPACSPATAAKRSQQFERDGMIGHPQADGILAAGDGIRHPGLLPENQGQRSGPEGFAGQLRWRQREPVSAQWSIGIMAGQMDDQRVVGRPPLGGEDPGDGLGIGASAPRP
jgi:hypothetical protein